MKTIGFVGLGDMGSGMSKNILRRGFDVKGYDLSETRLAELEAAGGTRATSCKELGESCDTIFIMVLNGNQVKQVILGEDGILAGAQPGTTIIVSATIKPSEIAELIEPVEAA